MAEILRLDHKRYECLTFCFELALKIDFYTKENMFQDAVYSGFLLVSIARELNDFCFILHALVILSELLLFLESPFANRVLQFIGDLATQTNQLSFLIESYIRLGGIYSERKEYEKAIRLFKKLLKVIWVESDTKQEIKLYELMALQYFYLQDIQECRKYMDRALRGKLEGEKSSVKSQTLQLGFRATEDRISTKRTFFAAHVQRKSHITKYSDQIVHSYQRSYELMERPVERPSFKQIADEAT